MAKAAAKSADAVPALDFLAETKPGPLPPMIAVFGDEPFLKRLALAEIKRRAAGGDDADLSCTELAGDEATPRDVFDELSTLSLFGGGPRVVVFEEADKFVTNYRDKLEDYAAKPSSAGVLVLEVATWPSNTRLYKAVAAMGLNLQCTAPAPAALVKWLTGWAKRRYEAKLEHDAAEMLVDVVGPELGLLDQEVAKLAAAAGSGPITCELVDQLVGTWRTKTAWEMIDAVVEGRAPEALKQLDRLLAAGEHPIALLAQAGPSLRRFAAATRLLDAGERAGRRVNARQLLQEVGVKPFVLDRAEKQWRQLGRRRAGRLYQWLLEADLALKGRSSSPPRARLVLEQLAARLSEAADPRHA
jgi:DNA polymerase-3 subunit delta